MYRNSIPNEFLELCIGRSQLRESYQSCLPPRRGTNQSPPTLWACQGPIRPTCCTASRLCGSSHVNANEPERGRCHAQLVTPPPMATIHYAASTTGERHRSCRASQRRWPRLRRPAAHTRSAASLDVGYCGESPQCPILLSDPTLGSFHGQQIVGLAVKHGNDNAFGALSDVGFFPVPPSQVVCGRKI